jgi:spore germination cell wall hydrolase CwlJ-like protein
MKLSVLLMIANWLPQPLADQTCLAATLYLEARDQPVLGQIAVAEVALRRQANSPWPDDLCRVLTQPKQFALSLVSQRYLFRNLPAWNRAWAIAGATMQRWSINGERLSVVPEADHFFAHHRVTPAWAASGEQVARIGDHAFYRLAP